MTETHNPSPTPDHHAITAEHLVPRISMGANTIGLGRSAVALRLEDAPDIEAQERALQSARYTLQEVEEEDRDRMNNLLCESMPNGLKQLLGAEQTGESGFDVIGLLTATEGFGRDRRYIVPDQTFANFLDWHHHKLAAKQAELDNSAEQYKAAFVADIHKAIDEGWMPASVLEQLPRLDNVKMILDDGFTTMVDKKGGYAGKINNSDVRGVALSPEMLRESPKNLTYHEFLHIIAGTDIDPSRIDDSVSSQETNRGMLRLLGRYGGHAIDEATVEHITLALIGGNVDAIKPEDRGETQDEAIYYANRTFLDTLCYSGKKKIDIRLFVAEHFRQPDLSIDWDRAHMMHRAFGDPLPEDPNSEPNPALIEAMHQSFAFTDVIAEVKALRSDSMFTIEAYTKSLQERAAAA